MIFTDAKFFIFFAVVFSVYWAVSSNFWRKLWLLAASVVFYAAWDWRFLGLVLLVIVNTYATTLLVAATEEPQRRRRIVAIGIVVSLGVLAFFKYYNFFIDSLSRVILLQVRIQDIVLPIGISFYTFHSLSYMIDTYRGKIAPTKNVVDVALYILFFPQLVAGPIVRAPDLLPQMRSVRPFPRAQFKLFLLLFLVGYFKKAVVSDNASSLVDMFYAAPEKYGAADGLIAVFFYAVQIYCDFSGYTDMAIATAGVLGYRLKPNFNHPYLAPNIAEFWRRWHMSLSSWLRDYLYIPLGGNRGGAIYQARNVMITMLLGGLWHGASWTFVLWGGLHGAALVVWRYWQRFCNSGASPRYSVAGNLLTFIFVCFCWMLFRASSFENFAAVVGRLAIPAAPGLMPWEAALGLAAALAALHIGFYRLSLESVAARVNNVAFAMGYGIAVAVILPFVNVAVQPFIYFQF
jgi:alginate O-acetyltransferase complex protein AlgI